MSDSESFKLSAGKYKVIEKLFAGYYTFKPIITVTLDPSAKQIITVDDTLAFTATVTPDTASDKTVKWSVNNSNVALYFDEACTTLVGSEATEKLTVYAKGMSEGDATVTVESNAESDKTATCTVTVKERATATAIIHLNDGTINDSKLNTFKDGLTQGYTAVLENGTITVSGPKKDNDDAIISFKNLSELLTKQGYKYKETINPSGKKQTVWRAKANQDYSIEWTANDYTVKFDGNGVKGTMEDQKFKYDEEDKALTKNEFKNEGNVFTGWNRYFLY